MFKILKDGIVIDILEKVVYVIYQTKNNLLLLTNYEYAQGVLSSDGSTIWQLKDRERLKGTYEEVEVIEVTDEEAIELRQILDGTGTDEVEIEDGGVEVLPIEQVYPKVPFTELQAMVQVLVDKVDKLEDENSRLKEIIEAGGGVRNE